MPHRYCERWKIYVTFFFFVKIYLLLGEGDKDRLEETKAHDFWKIWFLLPFHGNGTCEIVYEFEEFGEFVFGTDCVIKSSIREK